MKTENEIKTALLNEVIEIVSDYQYSNPSASQVLQRVKVKIQSLLPKEEPIDWSKASEEELIAEAKKRYPSGVSIDCLFGCGVGKIDHYREPVVDYDEVWVYGVDISGSCLRCFYRGKWAEIVEEPEKGVSKLRDELKETFKESYNVDLTWKPEPTQEIKAGDEVEVRDGECDKWKDGWVFTGGYNLDGLYICEREHFLEPFNYIRKPTKTQEEMDREKAGELYTEWFGSNSIRELEDLFLEAINYGRNTKQN